MSLRTLSVQSIYSPQLAIEVIKKLDSVLLAYKTQGLFFHKLEKRSYWSFCGIFFQAKQVKLNLKLEKVSNKGITADFVKRNFARECHMKMAIAILGEKPRHLFL